MGFANPSPINYKQSNKSRKTNYKTPGVARMPKEDSVSKAIDLGKDLYMNSKFEKACTVFTLAITRGEKLDEEQLESIRLEYGLSKRPIYDESRIWHPLLCQALDFRSVCYEKLEKYKESLQDGKSMISHEPFNMRGYIRCGRMYENSLKKPLKALKYYEVGLIKASLGESQFSIEPNHKLIKYLETKVKNIKEATKPFKPILLSTISNVKDQQTAETIMKFKRKISSPADFFKEQEIQKKPKIEIDLSMPVGPELDIVHIFPLEILNKIMGLLNTRDGLHCMRVSKMWCQYMYTNPTLLLNSVSVTNHTDFQGLRSFINNCRKTSSAIVINNLQFKTSPLLEKKLFALFFELILTKTTVVSNLVLVLQESNLAHIYTCLQENLKWCSNLRELSIVCPFVRVPKLQQKLLNICPRLENLEILYSGVSPSRTSPSIGDGKDIQDVEVHTSLKSINIANIVFNSCKIQLSQFPKCPNLKRFFVFGMKVHDQYFDDIGANFPKLQYLKLEKLYDFTLYQLLTIFTKQKLSFNLRKLIFRENKITGMPSMTLTDNESYNLSENLAELRELDFYSSSITYSNLLSTIRNCFNLEYLNIGNCPYLNFHFTSHAAISSIFDQLQSSTNIKMLLMPQLVGINSLVFETVISKEIVKLESLKFLDLSFNQEIDGVNMWSLVKNLQNPDIILSCNGCSNVDSKTLESIKVSRNPKYVKNIIYEYSLKQWNHQILKCYYT